MECRKNQISSSRSVEVNVSLKEENIKIPDVSCTSEDTQLQKEERSDVNDDQSGSEDITSLGEDFLPQTEEGGCLHMKGTVCKGKEDTAVQKVDKSNMKNAICDSDDGPTQTVEVFKKVDSLSVSESVNRNHDCISLKTKDQTKITSLHNTELNLMEELFLLDLIGNKPSGFYGDFVGPALRGCILAELALRGKVGLDPEGKGKIELFNRKVVHVFNSGLTGEDLLDDVLKLVDATAQPESVLTWLEYLNGETWNPFKRQYRLTNVRERLAKGLVLKGVCGVVERKFFWEKQSYCLVDSVTKMKLLQNVHHAIYELLALCSQKYDNRMIALLFLAQSACVLEGAFISFPQNERLIGEKRCRQLYYLNYDEESVKNGANEMVWAVISALCQ